MSLCTPGACRRRPPRHTSRSSGSPGRGINPCFSSIRQRAASTACLGSGCEDLRSPRTAAGRSGSRARRARCRCSSCGDSMLPPGPYARASITTPASTRCCRSSATTAGTPSSACKAGSPPPSRTGWRWSTRTRDAKRHRSTWNSSGWPRGVRRLRAGYAIVGDAVVGFFPPLPVANPLWSPPSTFERAGWPKARPSKERFGCVECETAARS